MNLILIFDSDFIDSHTARLSGRRFLHIRDVLKAQPGQDLSVGKLDSLTGTGRVVLLACDAVVLEVCLNQKPPEPLALTLIVGLPRPPAVKRVLFFAAMLGIKKIIILNFRRVEKSLWRSSVLQPDAIRDMLILGLEQAKDTRMPEVALEKRFKPFVEDQLPSLVKGSLGLVADPGSLERLGDEGDCPLPAPSSVILVIGPEGGIIDYEMALLKKAGCKAVNLGARILRIEAVVPFVVGKLF